MKTICFLSEVRYFIEVSSPMFFIIRVCRRFGILQFPELLTLSIKPYVATAVQEFLVFWE